jgi:hypothetical protein
MDPRRSGIDGLREPALRQIRYAIATAEDGRVFRAMFRISSEEAVRSIVASGVAVTILSDIAYRRWPLDGRMSKYGMSTSRSPNDPRFGIGTGQRAIGSVQSLQGAFDRRDTRRWSATGFKGIEVRRP